MSKNLEAIIRGYLYFDVNGIRYDNYDDAKAARVAVPENKSVIFKGFHIFKGWQGFYVREIFGKETHRGVFIEAPTVTMEVINGT